jgi:hypothetical protein
MLHHALGSGVFTARKRLKFAVASCWRLGGALAPDYYPILHALDRFADRPDLPGLHAGERFFARCFLEWRENENSPVAVAHGEIRAAAEAVMARRCAQLLPAGGRYYLGHPGFEAVESVLYAVEVDVFGAGILDVDGSLVRSRLGTGLLRDLLGNPLRPVSFGPLWHSDTAVSLARRIYETRDFSAMPILADALQDAGCDNDDVLSHCRGPHEAHVRGCWVVDSLLEKS